MTRFAWHIQVYKQNVWVLLGRYIFKIFNQVNPVVHRGLGLEEGEEIAGFIYLGSRQCAAKPLPVMQLTDFVQAW